MRDIGLHLGGWGGVSVHEDPSDEMMRDDSGAESESTAGAERPNPFSNVAEDRFPSSESDAVTIAEDGVVSVSVGLPRRFGNPLCSEEDPESQEATELQVAPDPGECTLNGSLREILRTVTVKETTLRSAIENLGGGVKGVKAVVDYVKYFQETRDPNAGVNPDDFTRGLEQFCMLNGQRKEVLPQNQSLNPGTSESEGSGAGMEHQNRQTVANLQIRAQEEWSRNEHAADPYRMGYMENMSGYFPNFCYPYPPAFAGYGPFNMGVRPIYVPMMGVPYFPPHSHEYMPRTEAISRASRKSRIARRRGQGTDAHHTRPATKPAHVVGGISVQSGNQESTSHQNHAGSSSRQVAQGLSSRDLVLILQKQLSPSGVSSLGRIVLPKKEAETHLPQLVASEGVLLTMTDYDTAQSWTFRYRFWSNNKSRMYLLENTRDFVKARNLQERDMLSLYRDAQGSYVVRGEKSSANQTGDAATDTAAEDIPIEEDLPNKKQKF